MYMVAVNKSLKIEYVYINTKYVSSKTIVSIIYARM